MLIILEGHDGSGKTTLAQALAAELGRTTSDKVEVWHRGAPTSHPLDEYLRPLYDYRPGTGHHLILDRWHWGERVYPKILSRPTELDDAVWWSIESYLQRLGAVVVHCELDNRDDYVTLYRERGIADSVNSWQLDELDEIRMQFTQMYFRSQVQTLHYRYGLEVDRILRYARTEETDCRSLNDFTTYLGPTQPAALLLGDVRNLQVIDGSPAFVPIRSSSGHYLLRALTSVSTYSWQGSIGVANACDVDNLVQLHDSLGLPPIVALGKNAYGRILTSGIRCGVVPHPQFVRRFHHDRHVEYGELIKRAIETQEDYSRWPQSFTPTTDEPPTSTSSPSSGSSEYLGPVVTVRPVN
jgi:energy-coupling factor transporter ATP-binding protein EcfA2